LSEEKHVRISQCMIVKNEEKNIERALSWGRDMMWEQIVVDTGSTDRTVELARKMGAKVFTFPWQDDFATAKNYAIEKAGGEWIAFLDADEYMGAEDVKSFQKLLDELELNCYDGISTGWQQLDSQGKIFASGTQIRFFRNLPDIRYRRRIHEQLISTAGRELKVGDVVSSFSIFHTGYQGEISVETVRSSRNRRMILKELQENPADHEMMGYMGDECFCDGDRGEAEHWYRQSVEFMPAQIGENDQRSAVTYTRLLMILTEKERSSWEEAGQIYEKAVKHLPKEADFDYIAGRFFAATGQAEQAVFHLELALEKMNTYGCSNRALILAGNLLDAYELLVRCCYEAGEKQKCVSYGAVYLQYDKYSMSVLSRLLMMLAMTEDERDGAGQQIAEDQGRINQTVLEFFSKYYDFSDLKDRLFLVTTAKRAGSSSFAAYALTHIFTPQERSQLGLAI
jgi:tetratricopeptide (TPR) repeat protein